MAVAITRKQTRLYVLSTETKPTEYTDGGKIHDGQWLREVDTGLDYIYYGGTWYPQ